MKINNVLSLFDGIGCGIQALKESEIRFDNYYSCETDKYAVKVTLHNHPEVIPVGDVRNLIGSDYENVDLMFAGSPCQDVSSCGTRRGLITKGGQEILSLEQYLQLRDEGYEFEGSSYLFYEFLRLLKEIKPKYFLLENVNMPKKWQKVISDLLGVQPVRINSSSFIAQNRDRLYWTNIPVGEIVDRSPKLSDFIPQAETGYGFYRIANKEKSLKAGKTVYDRLPRINKNNIANCLVTNIGNHEKNRGTNHYLTVDGVVESLTVEDMEVLQGLRKGYTDVICKSRRIHALGNGWTVPVISHILNGMKPNVDKDPQLRILIGKE